MNKIVGQYELIKKLKKLIYGENFPHFIILIGPKGSGKKTIIESLVHGISPNCIMVSDIGVASVRQMIDEAYKYQGRCYIIPDADGMSVAAKNALLKVTEEPPNNTYFIMTLQDINNTLPTIKSRATVFTIDPYSRTDLLDYIENNFDESWSEDDIDKVTAICTTPGEINEMQMAGVYSFYSYVKLVFDKICDVSIANAFKIPEKVSLKDDDKGYDLGLFWRIFIKLSLDKASEYKGADRDKYIRYVMVTSKCLQELRIKGINRQMLMDNWILDIREEAV